MNKFLFTSIMIVFVTIFDVDCKYFTRSYRMPKSCKGQKYCLEKGEYYPTDAITSILERKTEFDLTGEDTEPSACNTSEESECSAVYNPNTPIYYIVDNSNRTRVVIQSTREHLVFTQKYDISRCVQEGPITSSLHFSKMSIGDTKLKCENVYVSFGFFVASLRGLTMELVQAKLPVYCKCTYDKQ